MARAPRTPRPPRSPPPPSRIDEELVRIEAKIDGLLRVAEALIRTQAKFVEMAQSLIQAQASVKPMTVSPPVPPAPEPAAMPKVGLNGLTAGPAIMTGEPLAPENPVPAPPAYHLPPEHEYEDERPASMSDIRDMLADEMAEDEPPAPEPDPDDIWRRRLSLYRQSRLWASEWGPQPGHEGCLVPSGL